MALIYSTLRVSDTTLSQLKREFEKWRATRKRKERVPNVLRAQALYLLKTHSWREVAETIGTNTLGLQNWQAQFEKRNIAVEIYDRVSPVPDQTNADDTAAYKAYHNGGFELVPGDYGDHNLEIKIKGKGVNISIKGDASSENWKTLVNAFAGNIAA